jgi:anaphase-promoting complex subunit 1
MWFCRIEPSIDWIGSQIPEPIKSGVLNMSEGAIDCDEFDAEALFQAYVNIVTGACIAIGEQNRYLFLNAFFLPYPS